MKSKLFSLLLILLIISCKKDNVELIIPESVILKPYMRNLVPIDTLNPYKGDYYIHASFKNKGNLDSKDIMFLSANQAGALTSIQSPDNTVLGNGWRLKNTATGEELEIAFHYNVISDTLFNLWYANYRFANSWNNITGANIYYFKPIESQSNTFNMYLGTNSNESFFKINYVGKDRINGSFQTTWEECCGEETIYIVSGDFSIPIIPKLKYAYIH